MIGDYILDTNLINEEVKQTKDISTDNKLKIYEVTFPYSVKFKIPDDAHNTEVIITTKSQEFFTAHTEEECVQHKKLSDKYSKHAFSKHIKRYVLKQLDGLDADDGEVTFTGTPEFIELTGIRLKTFSRELDEFN